MHAPSRPTWRCDFRAKTPKPGFPWSSTPADSGAAFEARWVVVDATGSLLRPLCQQMLLSWASCGKNRPFLSCQPSSSNAHPENKQPLCLKGQGWGAQRLHPAAKQGTALPLCLQALPCHHPQPARGLGGLPLPRHGFPEGQFGQRGFGVPWAGGCCCPLLTGPGTFLRSPEPRLEQWQLCPAGPPQPLPPTRGWLPCPCPPALPSWVVAGAPCTGNLPGFHPPTPRQPSCSSSSYKGRPFKLAAPAVSPPLQKHPSLPPARPAMEESRRVGGPLPPAFSAGEGSPLYPPTPARHHLNSSPETSLLPEVQVPARSP